MPRRRIFSDSGPGAPSGQRVWKITEIDETEDEEEVYYFYGATGELLAEYVPDASEPSGVRLPRAYRHFGGKLLGMGHYIKDLQGEPYETECEPIVRDRLG